MGFEALDLTALKQTVEGFGGLQTLKDVLSIAKQAKDLFGKSKDGKSSEAIAADVRELILQMQEKMLTAQEETTALRAAMLELLEELGRLQAFERDRDRYDLVETAPSNFAYKAAGPTRGDHQAIRYCAHCYQQSRRIVMLQLAKEDWYRDTLKCRVCDSEIFQTNDKKPTAHVGRSAGRAIYDYDPFDEH